MQGDLFRDPLQYGQPQMLGHHQQQQQQQPAALAQQPGSYPGMAQHGGGPIVGYPVQACSLRLHLITWPLLRSVTA